MRFSRFSRRTAPAAAILFLVLCGCGRSARLSFKGAPVVLVSIDTLRADHLPAYGYTHVATPGLDALRRDAVLFRSAWSQVPLTLPSHMSVFTGLYPADTGVRDNVGFRRPPKIDTLATLLKARGYKTGGAVSSIVLAGESGMKDGFDFYDDVIEVAAPNLGLGRVQRAGAETAALLEGWLAANAEGPFFAFLHVYEPHTPYEPPEPFKSRYASRPYDGEIAAADAAVGGFLSFLKGRGLYDKALVILMSDHGEGLGDHDEDEHGLYLYRETLRVPLMVKFPGQARANETYDEPVGLVDVLPTILSAVAPDVTQAGARGLSLGDLLRAKEKSTSRRIFSETVFPRLHYGWSDLASLVDDRWHLIEAPHPELYDMAVDPREEKDLAASLLPAFRSMHIEAQKLRVSRIETPRDVDPEQVAKLASLGYIGSTAAAPGAKDLPDPKEKAATVRAMRMSFHLLNDEKKPAESAAAFRALLKTEPTMADVWNGLAQAYRRLGRDKEALAALKETARLAPAGSTDHYLSIATLALELGKLDDARTHAELALKGGNPLAHEALASIALVAKDYGTAAKEIEGAKRINPQRRLPHLIAARLLAKQGRLEEALREVDAALAMASERKLKPLMTERTVRGDVLARLGRAKEAEESFLDETRLYPEDFEAYQDLALLYASQGRARDVYATLERMMSATPGAPSTLAAAKVLDLVGDRHGASALRKRAEKASEIS